MDNLLEALAKGMNVSIDGISELLGSIKDNTPQLYEQLVREWTYYTVLSKTSFALFIIVVILAVALVGIYKNCIVDWCELEYNDVPSDLTRHGYAKVLTQQNVNNNMGEVDVKLDCPLWILELQLSTMNAYLTVLKKRIELGDTHEV